MKRSLTFALALLLSPAVTAQEEQATAQQEADANATLAADSHTELADALVDFLSRTDACLATCTDEPSARAAQPQLEALHREAAELAARQAELPEPTVQDYMATQNRANDFLQLWQSIRAHLARMEKAGILLPEIRQTLHIAPETGATGL
ncbi:MAG: hypothetical protein MJ051_04045 [Akkermansia sp.]|nr:hypothetical protein [Akkermansia sp.]